MAFLSEDSVRSKHESGLGFYLPFCVLYVLQCSLIYEKYNFLGFFFYSLPLEFQTRITGTMVLKSLDDTGPETQIHGMTYSSDACTFQF